ncbi:TPA: hypothetical protein ACGR77_002705 [Pseudomonas aeruginosa]
MKKYEKYVATSEQRNELFAVDFECKKMSTTARTKLKEYYKKYPDLFDESSTKIMHLLNLKGKSPYITTDVSYYLLLSIDDENLSNSEIYIIEDIKEKLIGLKTPIKSVFIVPFKSYTKPKPVLSEIAIHCLDNTEFSFSLRMCVFYFIHNAELKGYNSIHAMFESPNFEKDLRKLINSIHNTN